MGRKVRIEYAGWVRGDELQRVLPDLITLRTDPPVRGADEDFETRRRIERQRLMVFYQAALNAQAGHPELWDRDMKRLFESDPSNPYFRWFGKGADQEAP
jgi:spermidine synthase